MQRDSGRKSIPGIYPGVPQTRLLACRTWNFFFHNVDVAMDGSTRLPDVYRLNLLAASKQFQSVELYMYQTLLDDVPGISAHNARCLTPEHVAAAFLEAGWRVQHIADRIRMQGIGRKGGWFCLDRLISKKTPRWI